jgi:hypothetical protein
MANFLTVEDSPQRDAGIFNQIYANYEKKPEAPFPA